MPADTPVREGQVLTGALFNEPMRVVTVSSNGAGTWIAGLVGLQSEQFRRVTLTEGDVTGLTIADPVLSYDGDGQKQVIASLDLAKWNDPIPAQGGFQLCHEERRAANHGGNLP